MKRLIFLLLIIAGALFGGQSVSLSGANFLFATVPQQLTSRIEWCGDSWDATTSGNIADISTSGWKLSFTFSGGFQVLRVESTWDTPGLILDTPIGDTSQFPTSTVCIRMERDNTGHTISAESWNDSGTLVSTANKAFTSSTPGTSFDAYYAGHIRHQFIRYHTNLLPLNSRQPTTVDNANRVAELKFDGNLLDASGNGHNAAVSGGFENYFDSSPFQKVIAKIKTSSAPSWAPIVSQRAGNRFTLDGTGSYSMGDVSAGVNCTWQSLSAPTQTLWGNRGTCTPFIDGSVYGNYNLQLRADAADPTGLSSTSNTVVADVGVAATDSKGVIVQANPAADIIFGPMLLFGTTNPWPWAEERAYCGLLLKTYPGTITQAPGCSGIVGNYDALEGFPASGPVWRQTGQGTVSYTYSPIYGGNMATTNGSITSTSVTLNSTANLDLTSMPIVLTLGDQFNTAVVKETAWVCSFSGAGNLTANFCYDGRRGTTSWPSGTPVNMNKVTGSGTLFLTDPKTKWCQAGAPPNATSSGTPFGQTIASGTLTAAHGSNGVVWVSGTVWTKEIQTQGGGNSNIMLIYGTHDGGTPFIFYSEFPVDDHGFSGFVDSTHLTMIRNFPATGDDATFSYVVLQPLAPSPYVTHIGLDTAYYTEKTPQAQGSEGGCASETSAFIYGVHDGGALNNQPFTGMQYTFMFGSWASGRGAQEPNFYGESLAHRAMCLRSGLKLACDAANNTALWASIPSFDFGRLGSQPYNTGGGALAALACVATDANCPMTWKDVRPIADAASLGTYDCEFGDSRTIGYSVEHIAVAALFDLAPPTGSSTYWTNKVASMYTSDNACKTPSNFPATAPWVNSWAVSKPYMDTAIQPIPLVSGQATVSYTGSHYCHATSAGTATATNGSGVITIASGTLPPPIITQTESPIIVVTGTKGGAPFWRFLYYSGFGGIGSVVTLSALWDGDTGTINWQGIPDNHSTVFAHQTAPGVLDLTDTELGKNWSCIYDGTAHTLTLNALWDSASCGVNGCQMADSDGVGGPAGTLQQPFMLTMRGYGYYLLSRLAGSLGTNYQTLTNLAATWQHDYGYEPVSQGMYYFRGAGCEPVPTPTPGTGFGQTTIDCNSGLDINGIMAARELSAENMKLVVAYYHLNPTTAAKTYGDTVFGSLMGNPAFSNTGYTPPNYNAGSLALTNGALQVGNKYYSFYNGMGMMHQWPAERLGGVDPDTDRRTYKIPFRLANVATAAEVVVTITEPNGLVHVNPPCTTSPCSVPNIDGRQGNHLYRITYQNSSHVALSTGDVMSLYVAP